MATPKDPNLFYLEMPDGYPGDQYRVQLHFFQDMLFERGQYVARLPTRLHYLSMLQKQGVTMNSLLEVEVTINTGVEAAPGACGASDQAKGTEITEQSLLLDLFIHSWLVQ
jgi:hypothetical protein